MLKDFEVFYHILNFSLSWRINRYESKMDKVIRKKDVIAVWTNWTISIRLKHPDFIENRAHYRKFFVFSKVHVFKQGYY